MKYGRDIMLLGLEKSGWGTKLAPKSRQSIPRNTPKVMVHMLLAQTVMQNKLNQKLGIMKSFSYHS